MTILDSSEVLEDLGVTDPTTAQISRMNRSARSAQAAAEDYLGYPLELAEYTEFYPILAQRALRDPFVDVIRRDGGTALILANRPVLDDDDLAVYEQIGAMAGQADNAFPEGSLLTKGRDYFLDITGNGNYSLSGILYRRAGAWSADPGSIKVTYNAGFSAANFRGSGSLGRIGQNIYDALVEEAKRDYRQRSVNASSHDKPVPMASESIGDYSYSSGGGNTAEVANVMDLSYAVKKKLCRYRKLGGRLA